MAKMECEICENYISKFSSYMVKASGKFQHEACHDAIVADNERIRLKQLQEDAQREAQELAAARAKAEKEVQDARALALRNADLERQRIASLVQAERERLKDSGAPAERFSLVEVATPEEISAIDSLKLKEQEDLRARQEADAKKINKCVRCGAVTISQEHPNHCSKCWNTDPAKPVQQDLEQDIKDALKRGVRPLELE